MTEDNAARLPEDHCPVCLHLLDGASYIGSEKILPEAGDVSICLYCGAALMFDEHVRLRALDPNEQHDIVKQVPKYGEALEFIRHQVKQRAALEILRGYRPSVKQPR